MHSRHRITGGIFVLLIALLLVPGFQQVETTSKEIAGVSIGQNFRIYPSSVTQTETFITRHPLNPDILFASANTFNSSTAFLSEGVYVSTNGGLIWSGSDTCNGAPILFHGGDPGIAIDRNGTFILIRLSSATQGLYSHYSTNLGVSWSGQGTVATEQQDRASLVSDGDSSSTYYGRTYAFWVRFSPPFPVVFSRTDNGGQNWSAVTQINSPPQRCLGGELAIGSGGIVHGCWAGVIGVSPFTEDYVGFAKSTDGGSSWTVTENAFDVNGIAGTLPQKSNIRVNGLPRIDVDKSGGSRNGWMYIVTTQKNLSPAGTDPDIILNRSTDGGATWSAGIRVNQDAPNNGKIQYFPAIHVDDYGGVNVLYYDDRNTTSDSATMYLSRSTDGGDTWNDFRISDHNFRPVPISGLDQGYQGDNIGMTSTNDTLWPVWMDNSSGIYQIWTCPVALSDITSVPPESPPSLFRLKQNYPNPFNPTTTIEYELARGGMVSLKVYDVAGREIATLVHDVQPGGKHTVEFDRGGFLSSGIYLYRLTAAGSSAVRKMLLVK